MKCPECRFEIPDDANFCSKCGCELKSAKSALSSAYSHPQSYTPKFLADKILSSRSAIEGERKIVTVLFADVTNYTSMAEKLDPEDVHKIMDGCFKILMNEIHDYQGTINQFTGDGVMALFGAPLALEDHARKACQAALSIQKTIREYSDQIVAKYGLDFKMRIGLNSGPVIVGSIGDDLRMDYTAIGDTTNLSARMEGLAEPGTVMVSTNTYKRVNQHFNLEPLGKTDVKGKEEPIAVYKLVSKIDRPGASFDRQIFSEMVGRDEDLNKLELQVLKAVGGEGSVVSIIGEAGIGKSRLVAELKNIDVLTKKVAILEGRAISIGRNLSFHPIISLLKHWARIKEDDSEATALGKLEAAVKTVHPEAASEIIPFIATLMGMKLSGRYARTIEGIEGEALQKNILKNMKDLLIKANEITPLVLVMEDLHWADISSIELLESLFRLAEKQRIVFVNVFRPDHKETGDRILETLKDRPSIYTVDIRLKPLDEKNSETLINDMLNIKGLYHGVKDKMIQRSGGNPFFIEEVVRSFIDEGAVVKTNGAFEVTEKIDTMVIPQTINDVIMARLDRLEENTRNLVKVASVIGRNFFYRILTEVSEKIESIDSRLDYLKTIQLIRERKRMEEIEYLFKHALAQEAAYESILLQKRKELHLKVAESIEKVFKGKLHEFYGMLALHYNKGEDEEKTEEFLMKAGEEALKSSASSEALYYFHEALDLYLRKYGETAEPKKIALLNRNIALAYFNKGQATEAASYLTKVLEFYGESEITLSLSGVFKLTLRFLFFLPKLYLPFLRWKKGPSQRDIEICYLVLLKGDCLATTDIKKTIILCIQYSNRSITFNISKLKNGIFFFTGFVGLFSLGGISNRLSKKILDVVKEKIDVKDTHSVFSYEATSVLYSFLSGDWKFAEAYNDNLLVQALETIDVLIPTYIVFHLRINIERGLYTDARKLVNRLFEIGNAYEHEVSIVHKYYSNAYLLMRYRKLREAQVELDEGIDFIDKTAFTMYLFAMYSIRARLQLIMGDYHEAENNLNQAIELESEVNPPPYHLANFLRSHFLFLLYQLEQSIEEGTASVISKNRTTALNAGKKLTKNSQKVVFHRVEAYKLMGVYYWLINKQRKAFKWWNKSIAEGERLQARLELSRTYFEVGKRLLEPESKYKPLNGIKAEEYLEKAKTMFEEMDLEYDLDELDKVIAAR